MLELKITNATIVDGTGSPRYVGEVNIKDGLIDSIGSTDEPASQVIDAEGRILAPGFIDVHTHYDAQAFWDPTLSPSSFHGVTTVFGGFCGFSIAPLSEHSGEYLMHMLARVEGIPIESLREGVPWDWSTFSEYLDRLDGSLAINAGFLCGHSALRRHVMGERAVKDEATQDEIDRMKELLRESIRGGALGFSSSRSITHSDGDGKPVPSRHAALDELMQLYAMVAEFEGTIAEIAPPSLDFDEQTYELLTDASLAAQRPINWNLLSASGKDEKEQARIANLLGASVHAEERGARVVALTLPQTPRVRLNMVSGVLLDTMPGWAELFRHDVETRKRMLRSNERLETMRQGAAQMEGMLEGVGNFARMLVSETFADENAPYRGRTIGEIVADQGGDPFDLFIAISLADDLRTSFIMDWAPDTPEMFEARADLWRHEHTVVGGGDAGAHLDMIDTFAISTELLNKGVVTHQVISLEEAVHQLTLKPAAFMGLDRRGKIAPGWHADLVIFDEEAIGAGETYSRTDLPAGGMRVYAEPMGISHVIVNGREIIRDNEYLGQAAGQIIRPGTNTTTVAIGRAA